MFVSHDRYFVERLATKIIEVGNGTAVVYPGTYKEFLWHKEHPLPLPALQAGGVTGLANVARARDRARAAPAEGRKADRRDAKTPAQEPREAREDQKRADAAARRRQRAEQARRARIDDLETRIAECENAIRAIEQTTSAAGFYTDRAAAQPIIDRHQALMWKVGDLMHQWEELQAIVSR
jgi:ATP-binding cassette, subfamily F, member 3